MLFSSREVMPLTIFSAVWQKLAVFSADRCIASLHRWFRPSVRKGDAIGTTLHSRPCPIAVFVSPGAAVRCISAV